MKTNYNYRYLAVSHTDHIIWGFGDTEEAALRDAMYWMRESSEDEALRGVSSRTVFEPSDEDKFSDYDLFRESKEYDDLVLIGITEAALKSGGEPNGTLTDWINAHEDIVYVNQIQSIMTLAECEAFYRWD